MLLYISPSSPYILTANENCHEYSASRSRKAANFLMRLYASIYTNGQIFLLLSIIAILQKRAFIQHILYYKKTQNSIYFIYCYLFLIFAIYLKLTSATCFNIPFFFLFTLILLVTNSAFGAENAHKMLKNSILVPKTRTFAINHTKILEFNRL